MYDLLSIPKPHFDRELGSVAQNLHGTKRTHLRKPASRNATTLASPNPPFRLLHALAWRAESQKEFCKIL